MHGQQNVKMFKPVLNFEDNSINSYNRASSNNITEPLYEA